MQTKMNETSEKNVCGNVYWDDSAIFSSNVTVKRVFFCLRREKVVIISGVGQKVE